VGVLGPVGTGVLGDGTRPGVDGAGVAGRGEVPGAGVDEPGGRRGRRGNAVTGGGRGGNLVLRRHGRARGRLAGRRPRWVALRVVTYQQRRRIGQPQRTAVPEDLRGQDIAAIVQVDRRRKNHRAQGVARPQENSASPLSSVGTVVPFSVMGSPASA
jgi:hypothetical protein